MDIPEIDYKQALDTSRSSITNAVQALAETGQIKVWTLLREGDDLPLICATLDGAINAAANMLADELVHRDENNLTNRMKYVDYISDDIGVAWKFPEAVRKMVGMYDIITTTPDGVEVNWSVLQQELLP